MKLKVSVDSHSELLSVYIVPKLSKEMIFGIPWLRKHNPTVHWPKSTIRFESSYCINRCLHEARPVTIQGAASPKPIASATYPEPNIDVTEISIQEFEDEALDVPEDEIFVVEINQIKTAEDYAEAMKDKRPPDFSKIPSYLRDYEKLFSPVEANRLPPSLPGVDHDIRLIEGAKPPCGRMYNMSQDELRVLKKYIEENLEKGYIRPSASPVASPVIFVRKNSGGLRLCVDYRKLNDVTIKDRTPMPLTKETFARLSRAKFFTKVDVISAFNKIRIKPGKEYLSAFRTRYGLYEYTVMPFGMSNAPSTFNRRMNDVLGLDILDSCASAYSDDILIYSETEEEHRIHVRKVFDRLLSAGLFLDIDKSEFSVKRVHFLGYIIEAGHGVSLDPKKLDAVRTWATPKTVKEIRGFLGFVNYFRRFIKGFSGIAKPLTDLTHIGTPFVWTPEADLAFRELRDLTLADPVLALFDPQKPCHLFTDASDFASGAVLKQPTDESDESTKNLRPVGYFSAKHVDAELRYDAHDKELLAIVKALKEWRAELQGSKYPTKIHSDHKNLGYFMTSNNWNSRQARWLQFLSEFDFRISYVPGKTNNAADALSRRQQDFSRPQAELELMITPDKLEVLPVSLDADDATLAASISRAYAEAPPSDQVVEIIRMISEGVRKHPTVTLADCSLVDGRLFYQGSRLWLPEDDSLRRAAIESCHSPPLAGHPGDSETYRKLHLSYYWPHMIKDVRRFIRNCHQCQRTKSSRRTQGELLPLPVPQRRWQDITMDYITDLPQAASSTICPGATAILVVVDRLSKEKHFVPCTSMNTEYLARVFLRDVIRLHGIPRSVVTDRGSQFLSSAWRKACIILGIKQSPTSAFHPQSDGQSERANQDIERQLRGLVNHTQDNWVDWLPVVEFAMNNAATSATGMTPFFANKGFHPAFTTPEPPPSEERPSQATTIDEQMDAILKDIVGKLTVTRQLMADSANSNRTPHHAYQPGDLRGRMPKY